MISAQLRLLEDEFRGAGFSEPLREYTPAECDEFQAALSHVLTEKGLPKRALTQREVRFIANELRMCKADWRYWAARYAQINLAGSRIGRMWPLLESQEIVLQKLGELESAIFRGERKDGLLINFLKGSRQVGGSTLAEAIGAHRFAFRGNLFGLIASDVPGPTGSGYLFEMFERMILNLPWWMRPKITDHVKNEEMAFEGGSHIWVGAGKSTRGKQGQRGQLGRGKALAFVHLSEVSTWEDFSQIDSSLMPTIHQDPGVFAMFESTAKGRNDSWHKHWNISRAGIGRFTNIFIPWFAERRYASAPPTNWSPNPATIAHAKRAESLGPRWVGRRVSLSKDQLYWYESTRLYYEAKDDLHTFLEEFGAVDDDECFQFSGKSVFPLSVLQRVQDQMRPIVGVVEVVPQAELR